MSVADLLRHSKGLFLDYELPMISGYANAAALMGVMAVTRVSSTSSRRSH